MGDDDVTPIEIPVPRCVLESENTRLRAEREDLVKMLERELFEAEGPELDEYRKGWNARARALLHTLAGRP